MYGLVEFAIVEEIFKAVANRFEPKSLPKLVNLSRLFAGRAQVQIVPQEEDCQPLIRDTEGGQVTLTQC